MLDCYYIVYLWFGSKSKEVTKSVAMITTQNYVKQVKEKQQQVGEGEQQSIPILVVKHPYQEPLTFSQFFFGWSRTLFPRDKVTIASGEALLSLFLVIL